MTTAKRAAVGPLSAVELQQSARRHKARQLRARIVELAQEYKEAAQQHEQVSAYVLRLDVEAPAVLRGEEERTWEAMEQRREALFAALGELEELEELESLEEEGR